MKFDPFENRLCRDVRNELGHNFIKALQTDDPDFFEKNAKKFIDDHPQKHIEIFIHGRLQGFRTVYPQVRTLGSLRDHFYDVFRILWNLALFFECHEWVEDVWINAANPEKEFLQGLILAAIAYEHHTYNRLSQAAGLGAKAVKKMKSHTDIFPGSVDIKGLIKALDPISPPPEV